MKFVSKNLKGILFSLFVLALLLFPMIITNKYQVHTMVMIFFWASTTAAWNLIGGFAGQVSLGHAAFFGIGAYTSTLLYIRLGVSPWIGLFLGGILAAIVAALISYPCFKLRGPFFTLSTIAFGEVIHILATYFRELTGGAVGLLIPFKAGLEFMMFRGKVPYYYLFLALMLVMILVTYIIARSKMGYYLISLREDEEAAQAIGVNTSRYKLYAVMLSAFFCGAAGVAYAQYILFIEPLTFFSTAFSTQFALMSIIGGLGTVAGPIVGAFILTPLSELLRGWLGGSYAGLHYVIYGIVLIAVVLNMPEGIVVWFNHQMRALKAKLRKSKADEVKP
jgi:branched-chain amino acid transport system permease protein